MNPNPKLPTANHAEHEKRMGIVELGVLTKQVREANLPTSSLASVTY